MRLLTLSLFAAYLLESSPLYALEVSSGQYIFDNRTAQSVVGIQDSLTSIKDLNLKIENATVIATDNTETIEKLKELLTQLEVKSTIVGGVCEEPVEESAEETEEVPVSEEPSVELTPEPEPVVEKPKTKPVSCRMSTRCQGYKDGNKYIVKDPVRTYSRSTISSGVKTVWTYKKWSERTCSPYKRSVPNSVKKAKKALDDRIADYKAKSTVDSRRVSAMDDRIQEARAKVASEKQRLQQDCDVPGVYVSGCRRVYDAEAALRNRVSYKNRYLDDIARFIRIYPSQDRYTLRQKRNYDTARRNALNRSKKEEYRTESGIERIYGANEGSPRCKTKLISTETF